MLDDDNAIQYNEPVDLSMSVRDYWGKKAYEGLNQNREDITRLYKSICDYLKKPETKEFMKKKVLPVGIGLTALVLSAITANKIVEKYFHSPNDIFQMRENIVTIGSGFGIGALAYFISRKKLNK